MWWRNWWEAARDPFDPVPRRLWKALIVFIVGACIILVVWPRVRVEWLAMDLHADPESPTARIAAWRLGEIGASARSALPPLIQVLDLGPIEQPPRSSREHHVGALSVEAARAIGKIGAPETQELLLQRMRECRVSERGDGTGAARLFIALQNARDLQPGPPVDDQSAIDHVVEVLQNSSNAETCSVLLNWLHARSLIDPDRDADGRIKPVLIDCLSRLHVPAAARLLIAWAKQDPDVVPVILDEERRRFHEQPRGFTSAGVLYQPICGRENSTVRDSLPLLTDELSGGDAPLIIQLLAESFWFDDQQDRHYGRQPRRTDVFLGHFRQALVDERNRVRLGVLQTLTRIEETRSAENPACQKRFDVELLAVLAERLSDEDPSVRAAAAVALWNIEHQAVPGLNELLTALEGNVPPARRIAREFFAGVGPRDAWATDVLIGRLEQSTPTAQIVLVKGLAAIRPAADTAVPALIPLLTTAEQPVRIETINALAEFGKDAKEALPHLWQVFLNSDDVDVRRQANLAMSRIDPKRMHSKP